MTTSTYDEVPYTQNAFLETHPDRLRATAMLFGLAAPPAERCRVLELGCGRGGNLIPLAYTLPQARFLGIDLSARQIGEAAAMAAELKLPNVEFRAQSILDIAPDVGQFDYIIAHGVFSWVPTAVQDKILAICRDHLASNGLAYISYNTYPGWHMRNWARDAMAYHALQSQDPQEKVRLAREFLQMVAASPLLQGRPIGPALRSEFDYVRDRSDSYLLHEHLESENQPFYFHQFMARAAGFGLHYLGDARLNGAPNEESSPQSGQILRQFSGDIVRREQYLDFLRNQTFRRSLLCREPLSPDRSVAGIAGRLPSLYLTAAPRREAGPGTIPSADPITFRFANGAFIRSSRPAFKAALTLLGQHCPASIGFAQLWDAVQAMVQIPGDQAENQRRQLAEELSRGWMLNLIELRTVPPQFAGVPGERPTASAVARYQARTADRVANLRHEMVALSPPLRAVLPLLDGTRTADDLARSLLEGHLVQVRAPDAAARQKAAVDFVNSALTAFARESLLLG